MSQNNMNLSFCLFIYHFSSGSTLTNPPIRRNTGGVYLNTRGCAPLLRWRYVICERSLYKRVRAIALPPHSAHDFLSGHIIWHIGTQIQRCAQSYTDVLLSLWYFLVFPRAHKFSCSRLFLFSKKLVLEDLPWLTPVTSITQGSKDDTC